MKTFRALLITSLMTFSGLFAYGQQTGEVTGTVTATGALVAGANVRATNLRIAEVDLRVRVLQGLRLLLQRFCYCSASVKPAALRHAEEHFRSLWQPSIAGSITKQLWTA